MSIVLDHTLVINSVYALTTLPRKDNQIWDLIKGLKAGDKFKYVGTDGNQQRFQHILTGTYVILMPVFFLDSDTYFYSTKQESDANPALHVKYTTYLKELYGNKTTQVTVGTIFTKFRQAPDNPTKFIITANNGSEFTISASACVRIYDIEGEQPVSIVQPVKDKAVDTNTSGLSFDRSVTLNGVTFSSFKDADTAEGLVRQIHDLLHTVQFSTTEDTRSALHLVKEMCCL